MLNEEKRVVKLENDYFVFAFINREGRRVWHYDLHKSHFDSRRKLISQIYNLSQKRGWITAQHIQEMIEIAHHLVGKNPYTGEKV